MVKQLTTMTTYILLTILFSLSLLKSVTAQENEQRPFTVDIVTTQNPVIQDDFVTWYVTVSPIAAEAEIQNITFQSAADGQWVWQEPFPPPINILTSTQAFTITAVPLITGQLTPILKVTTRIDNALYSFFVSSQQPVTVNPIPENTTSSWLTTISDKVWEVLVILLSVILGVIVTLGTQSWKDHQEGQRQKKKHIGQVSGILTNVCINTQYAAENLSPADITLLKKLFESEGLYEIISDHDLTPSVKDVWKAAEAHNFGLDKPGGFERAHTLSQSTKNLSAKLNILEKQP